MRTRLILVLFLAGTLSSLAQKKELRAVGKAIKNAKFQEAKSLLAAAEATMGAMDDEQKAMFYLYQAQALYKDGAVTDIKDMLAASAAVKKSKELDATPEAENLMIAMRITIANSGVADEKKKDYTMAADKFEAVYRMNAQDTAFLYYAAQDYINAQDYDKAVALYKELQDLGYTGITEQYVATDAETGEKKTFQSKDEQVIMVKSGGFNNPKTVKTPSKKGEITKNMAYIYMNQGKNEEALETFKIARQAAPDDLGLLMNEAQLYYKMGDTEGFKSRMKEALAKDPNNPEIPFNLAIIAYESEGAEVAIGHYQNALEIDPKFEKANRNLGYLYIDQAERVVEEMNNLGTSAADNKRYDELQELQKQYYRDSAKYLEVANEVEESVDKLRALSSIYSFLGETDKYKAKKARLEELGG